MKDLQGRSMSQCLPIGDFHEVEVTDTNKTKIIKTFCKTPDNNNYGDLLEIDLEYPSKTHKNTFRISSRKGNKKDAFSFYVMQNKPVIIATVTKQNNNKKQISSSKLMPTQVFSKKNKGFVFQNLCDKKRI